MPNFLNTSDPDTQISPASEDQVPAYLLAADNHNLGNTRSSWFDPTSWDPTGPGKFAAVSILSGANSFYNTGVAIANWFGADAEENDTKAWISEIDSNLGVYYSQHRQAADLVGFVASSLIPGTLGIKTLNAGQTALRAATARGLIGENLSRATGLLVPQTEKYIVTAAKDINAATATFSAINANGVKALAAGIWQNTLEIAAVETFVQASMFRSPILEDQDKWDIVKNIAIGGVFSGAIGGAFSAASSLGKIKGFVTAGEREVKPFASREFAQEGTSSANKIILMNEDRDSAIASLLTETDPIKVAALKDRIRRIDNDVLTEFHNMTVGEDSELSIMIADASTGIGKETTLGNLLGSDQITRVSGITKLEKEQTAHVKETGAIDPTISVQYIKLTGEGAGVVSDSAPPIVNLADKVTVSAKSNTRSRVLDKVRSYKFKPDDIWNPLDLSRERGHLEAEARHIYASELLEEIPTDGTARIHQYDIPMLERIYKDGNLNVELIDNRGLTTISKFDSKDQLWKYIVSTKELVANKLLKKYVLSGKVDPEQGTNAIAKIVNTKLSRLEDQAIGNEFQDYLAWQTGLEDYQRFLKSKGLSVPANESADPRFLPTYAKISKRAVETKDLDGNIIDGMSFIKQQQQMLKLAVNNVFAKSYGELAELVPEISDAALLTANRYGSGAGLAKYANGAYGSLESIMQQIGNVVKQAQVKFRKLTEDGLQGVLVNLGNKQEAAIEWQTINQKVTRSAKQWIRHTEDDGSEYLITKDAAQKFRDPETNELDFDSLNASVPEDLIQIHNPETTALLDAHIARTGQRTQSYRELHAVQGHTDVKDPEVFRPIRPNPKDYPFFAFVTDPRVTGQGHKTMIFANSEAKLAELINKVPAEYKVVTKREVEEFKQARNEYEYQRTLHESYIDSDLKNRGIFSEFFTKTDPGKIVDDILQQHLRDDDILARELMRAKNQVAFDWLEDQGSAYSKVSSSRFGSSLTQRLESGEKNPYLDYIKTGLNISKIQEHPLIYGFNKFLDSAVSRAVGQINDVFANAKSPAQLTEINSLLEKYGMNTGYRDAATDLLVNHTAPKGELTKFVRGANAILAKLTLGLDPLNALNNFLGANILRATELKQVTDAIKNGDNKLAGQLADLIKINLPGGVGQITAPTKLVANAIRNFVQDDGTLLAQYKTAGYIKGYTQQFKEILDDFTLRGTESVPALNNRLTDAFKKVKELSELGEKATGNKFAEEFNRFISANVMDQLTSLAIKNNLLSKEEAAAYINTFVNRVEGNTIASQRPLMFQGPIGQALGLFQSYQFNLMQQMFRYVAEGTAKDSAMLLGLQGTFYGIQGLPAFQFINQHIVGTLSGNRQHTDLYDATYGTLGSNLGDLLLYGLPSNLLQANIYSRGDINPRQVTVIPTSLPEIPFVGAFGKFLGSMKATVDKINNGAPIWESMLQGLEHNGLSRPLAGLAQTLQAAGNGGSAYSTTSKGSILFSNDLMSWATAVRLAGGRPIDEAIINDGVFRIQSYQQYDRNKMDQLASGIKAASINGNQPDQEAMAIFAKKYAEAGGKQVNFNKFVMNEFKAANTSQSEKIARSLQNPFAYKMQVLMGGGSDTTPFTSTPAF